MFGLFKNSSNNNSSKIDKLNTKYQKLMEEAFKLSKTNRKLSDSKTYEANKVLEEIDKLKKTEN